MKKKISISIFYFKVFNSFQIFDLNLFEWNKFHNKLFLTRVKCTLNFATFWYKRISYRLRTVKFNLNFSLMMIFNHIFDDITFTFKVLDFGKPFIFFRQFKIFTKRRVDNFTMSSIVEFGAYVVLDEDIKLSV